jgi:hypothetical protein
VSLNFIDFILFPLFLLIILEFPLAYIEAFLHISCCFHDADDHDGESSFFGDHYDYYSYAVSDYSLVIGEDNFVGGSFTDFENNVVDHSHVATVHRTVLIVLRDILVNNLIAKHRTVDRWFAPEHRNSFAALHNNNFSLDAHGSVASFELPSFAAVQNSSYSCSSTPNKFGHIFRSVFRKVTPVQKKALHQYLLNPANLFCSPSVYTEASQPTKDKALQPLNCLNSETLQVFNCS